MEYTLFLKTHYIITIKLQPAPLLTFCVMFLCNFSVFFHYSITTKILHWLNATITVTFSKTWALHYNQNITRNNKCYIKPNFSISLHKKYYNQTRRSPLPTLTTKRNNICYIPNIFGISLHEKHYTGLRPITTEQTNETQTHRTPWSIHLFNLCQTRLQPQIHIITQR